MRPCNACSIAPGGGPCIGAVGGGTLCPPGGGASPGSGAGRGDAGACIGAGEPLGDDDPCNMGNNCGNICCIIAGLIGGAFGPDIKISYPKSESLPLSATPHSLRVGSYGAVPHPANSVRGA